MSIFTTLYTEILFRPLFNLLVGLTNVIPGHYVGLSILLVTLIVRLILLPSALHQAKQMQGNQEKMAGLRKEMDKIKKRFKDDKAKQAEETMALYKKAGVNPAGGCLPLLIQLPVLIALYRVFWSGLGEDNWHHLYSYVPAPETVQMMFLGIPLEDPSVLLGVVAGILQFVLMKYFTSTPSSQPGMNEDSAQMMASMQKNMMYMFPVMTVFISFQLPAALALYWVASTAFAIIQQYIVKKKLKLTSNAPVI